jgi:hypothetical protein
VTGITDCDSHAVVFAIVSETRTHTGYYRHLYSGTGNSEKGLENADDLAVYRHHGSGYYPGGLFV